MKKPLGNLFLALGVILIGVFAVARFTNSSESAAGLEAFEQARAEARSSADRVAEVEAVAVAAPLAQASAELPIEGSAVPVAVVAKERPLRVEPAQVSLGGVPEPDFSDWSDKRIAEYRESLRVDSELPLAVLSIDHLNIRVPVYNGATDLNLNRGVARIKGTARVGEQSNLGIAGHRDGFFRPLQNITVGDRIDLDTLDGQTQYRVTGIQIVNPEDVYVLKPTKSSTLTLVTCYPFYFVGSAPQRYIVTAEAEPVQVQS